MYSKLLISFLFISSSMGAFAGVKPEPINEISKEQAQYIFLIAEHHEHEDGHDHEGHDHHEMESDDNTKEDENQKPAEDEFKAKPYGQ